VSGVEGSRRLSRELALSLSKGHPAPAVQIRIRGADLVKE